MEMQKLKDMQATLMSERGKLFDLQAGCEGNSKEWHDYECQMQALDEQCNEIRHALMEMGCCV